VALTIGSWHFHPETPYPIASALKTVLTTSQGAVSFSSLILTTVTELKKKVEVSWQKGLIYHVMTFGCTIPFHLASCLLVTCLNQCLKMLTKFTLIIHCFTGNSFLASAKDCYQVMKRHFTRGFLTDAVSVSVLSLGSFIFSLAVTFVAWGWIDAEFHWHTLTGPDGGEDAAGGIFFFWLIFMTLNVYNPVSAEREHIQRNSPGIVIIVLGFA